MTVAALQGLMHDQVTDKSKTQAEEMVLASRCRH